MREGFVRGFGFEMMSGEKVAGGGVEGEALWYTRMTPLQPRREEAFRPRDQLAGA